MEVRYNLPSSRNETCKFDLNATVVKETKDNSGKLLGPVQNDAAGDGEEKRKVEKKKAERKKKRNKRKRCKGKNKKKKRCRKLPKHQPVKNIELKVCTQ